MLIYDGKGSVVSYTPICVSDGTKDKEKTRGKGRGERVPECLMICKCNKQGTRGMFHLVFSTGMAECDRRDDGADSVPAMRTCPSPSPIGWRSRSQHNVNLLINSVSSIYSKFY